MSLDSEEIKEIERGIAAYDYEQRLILRHAKRLGSFTDEQFDAWFSGREYRKRARLVSGITGDTFMLGGFSQSIRDIYLELMQLMVAVGKLDCAEVGDRIIYSHRRVGEQK